MYRNIYSHANSIRVMMMMMMLTWKQEPSPTCEGLLLTHMKTFKLCKLCLQDIFLSCSGELF